MNKKTLQRKKISAEKYFRRYLKIAPLSVALCRSVEAKNFASISKMKSPILDIGCGFGEFARVFFDKPIEMGVDNSPHDLFSAVKSNRYKNLTFADARELPFASKSFSTIISVSTFEHIKNVDRVLKEAYRVLKPNGLIVVTMETNKIDQHTFYRPIIKRIGLPFLSEFLTKLYNNIFHRCTFFSKDEWEKQIKNTGFIIEESRYIVSPSVIKLYDLFIATSWPSQLFKPFLGRRVVFRPQFIVDFLTSLFIKHIDEENADGTILFLVARKP